MRAAYSVTPALQTAGRRAKVASVPSPAAPRNSKLFRLFRGTLRHVAIPLVAGSVAAFACGGDDAPAGVPNDDTPPVVDASLPDAPASFVAGAFFASKLNISTDLSSDSMLAEPKLLSMSFRTADSVAKNKSTSRPVKNRTSSTALTLVGSVMAMEIFLPSV